MTAAGSLAAPGHTLRASVPHYSQVRGVPFPGVSAPHGIQVIGTYRPSDGAAEPLGRDEVIDLTHLLPLSNGSAHHAAGQAHLDRPAADRSARSSPKPLAKSPMRTAWTSLTSAAALALDLEAEIRKALRNRVSRHADACQPAVARACVRLGVAARCPPRLLCSLSPS